MGWMCCGFREVGRELVSGLTCANWVPDILARGGFFASRCQAEGCREHD
jgi:hypothetical protein